MRRKMGRFAGLQMMMLGAVLFSASQAYALAEIHLADITTGPGSVVPFDAILVGSTGEEIAGTQNDITFAEHAEIAGVWNDEDGIVAPDCAVNTGIRKGDSQFAFLPDGCATGTGPDDVNTDTCTGVRALILSLSNTLPIEGTDPGVRIYTCNVTVAAGATDPETLRCTEASGSDPEGGAIEGVCLDGHVTIAQATATPTGTATTEATDTPVGTNTPTRTNTRPPSLDTDDDGCQLAAPASGHAGWLLFAPAALLLWSRRRSR